MRGIKAIEVTNFQSIKHARLELGQLNIIVGDNRAGKTAILRAFNAACFNATGTGFIRRGEDSCRVVIELDNGPAEFPVTIIWTKKRTGSAEYVIDVDGNVRTFSKLGASVPEEVREELGIIEIDVDKTFSIRPQIHEQMQDPFIIDKSEGQAARALAKMTKLDVVVAAQTAIRSDLRRAKSDLSATQSLEADLSNQLRQFEHLEEDVRKHGETSAALNAVRTSYDSFAAKCAVVKQYEDALEAVSRLADIPDTDSLAARVEQFIEKVATYDSYVDYKDFYDRYKTLPEVEVLASRVDEYVEKSTTVDEYVTHKENLRNIISALEELKDQYEVDCQALGEIKTCPTCGQVIE